MRKFLLSLFLSQIFTNLLSQTNLQTGSAEISFPLHEYNDPLNRLSLNTVLSYVNGNGIKASDLASSVGTGWALLCGGFVTRIQHGEPDDQKWRENYIYPNSIDTDGEMTTYRTYVSNAYPQGYLHTPYKADDILGYSALNTTLFSCIFQNTPHPKFTDDREQDVFVFNFNGKQGEFVIGANREVKTLEESNFRIDFSESNIASTNRRTTIEKFVITDDEGIRYTFQDMQLDEVTMPLRMCLYNKITGIPVLQNGQIFEWEAPAAGLCRGGDNFDLTNNYKVYKSKALNQFTTSKWHLSEIDNPLTGKKIQFVYENYNVDYDADINASLGEPVGGGPEQLSVNINRVKSICKRLTKVIFSNSDELLFSYSSSGRLDLPGDNALNTISILRNNESIGGWRLDYGYFFRHEIRPYNATASANELPYARLCLEKLTKLGKGEAVDKPYKFKYFMDLSSSSIYNGVPARFSFYQDHWGYSNTLNWTPGSLLDFSGVTNSFGCEPNAQKTTFYRYNFFKTALKNMNVYKAPLDRQARLGMLKSVIYPLGGILNFEVEQNRGDHNGQETPYGGVRVSFTSMMENANASNTNITEFKYTTASGQSSGWGIENSSYTDFEEHVVNRCSDEQKYAGHIVRQVATPFFENTFAILNSSIFTSGITTNSTTVLSQIGTATVNALIYAAIVKLIVDELSGGNSSLFYRVNNYYTYSKEIANPLPFQYARVEAILKNGSGDVGKTIYEFTTPAEYSAFYQPTQTAPYPSRSRFASWLYGLPKATTKIDKDGNKTAKTEFLYYPPVISEYQSIHFKSMKWVSTRKFFTCDFTPTGGANSPYYLDDKYYPLTGKMQLQETKEYIYKSPTVFSTISTLYDYNAKNYLLSEKTVNSKGEAIELNYRYVSDYSIAGTIADMKSANMISPLLSTEKYILKGGQKYLIDAQVTEYSRVGNGDAKTFKKYQLSNKFPVLNSSVTPVNSSQLLRDANLIKQSAIMLYNSKGCMVETVGEGNVKASLIYDDLGEQTIAGVDNASSGLAAFTSFEKSASGGWVFPGSNVVSNSFLTGKSAFHFQAGQAETIEKNFNNQVDGLYRVSFWAKSGPAFVFRTLVGTTSFQPVAPKFSYQNTATGWTYYEFELQGEKIYIRNTNPATGLHESVIIDELRAYPSDAQMTSYTYDPLVGKTSENDENNRITYYQHDVFGRIKNLYDQNRNLIKTYEYNYKQ